MDSQTKKELEKKIYQEIKTTERDIDNLKELTKPIAPDCAIGRVTRMDAINNKSVAEANLRMLQQKMTNLQLAVSKLNEADFGVCSVCRKNINEKRLMFMPESRYCVQCAR